MLPRNRSLLAAGQLRLLYASARTDDGLITIYSKEPYSIAFFEPRQWQDAATYAFALGQRTDAYHVVNLLSCSASPEVAKRCGRGRESELQSIVALVAEIDTAAGLHAQKDYPPQSQALQALERMPLQPSIVNLSGLADGGLHVYWALERPVMVADKRARTKLKAISRAWQQRLRSELAPYRLDSTFDLVRVLRIAGCPNHKYSGSVTRPLLVEDRRYRIEDFLQYVQVPTPAKNPGDATAWPVGHQRRVTRCLAYLENVPDAVSGHHGHDRTFRAACECFRFGLSLAEAMAVMTWFNETKTPPGDKWTGAELEHKVESAFQTVRQQAQFGIRLAT